MEEILSSSQVRYRMTPHVGVQINMRHRKHIRSLYVTVSSKAVTDPTVIYLDIRCLPLPWDSRTNISPTVTLDARKRFKMDLTLEHMYKQFFPGGV